MAEKHDAVALSLRNIEQSATTVEIVASHNRKVKEFQSRLDFAMGEVCTAAELKEAVAAILDLAKMGNVKAFTAICDRLVGKPVEFIEQEIAGGLSMYNMNMTSPVDLEEIRNEIAAQLGGRSQ